ncbi:hypothetical protein COCSADRAFT_291411 [Bipolaris sorokiniana ND90Pr]|uniref:Uncharacterized protein n=1 Tax=Cochliobolus sativus (strain ND90Pr / ATCC 201652) TaxID=665912 RepID=M2RM12_COCSN|nr:uncharacterized protein COCSADRAFT_291411 [Bipolaris sorokiniana ND90Pr]EMD67654.1 hypothetical protein COCSADRAFT_291411 [Bipolaris sorokiniana ND90Pr]
MRFSYPSFIALPDSHGARSYDNCLAICGERQSLTLLPNHNPKVSGDSRSSQSTERGRGDRKASRFPPNTQLVSSTDLRDRLWSRGVTPACNT